MITILYTSMSLNGQVLTQEKRTSPPPVEVLTDFMHHVVQAGNMVMGRTSAQSLLKTREAMAAFGSVQLVVLSSQLDFNDDYVVVRSPEEALQYLAGQGFACAFIAGGAKAYNAFLANDLVDELIINISAEITTNGIDLVSQKDFTANFGLVRVKELNRSIAQLQLAKDKVATVW